MGNLVRVVPAITRPRVPMGPALAGADDQVLDLEAREAFDEDDDRDDDGETGGEGFELPPPAFATSAASRTRRGSAHRQPAREVMAAAGELSWWVGKSREELNREAAAKAAEMAGAREAKYVRGLPAAE